MKRARGAVVIRATVRPAVRFISSIAASSFTAETRRAKLGRPFVFLFLYLQELANLTCESSLEKEESNGEKVRELYDALSGGDAEAVQQLLAPDIEWWFHGPPACQYMMRMLTGQQQSDESFQFEPSSITAVDDRTVVAEGRNANVFWVHAWTVTDGVITQVREYFNTSLTVTRFAAPSSASSSSKPSTHCLPLWQSRLPRGTAKSMPALVLAI